MSGSHEYSINKHQFSLLFTFPCAFFTSFVLLTFASRFSVPAQSGRPGEGSGAPLIGIPNMIRCRSFEGFGSCWESQDRLNDVCDAGASVVRAPTDVSWVLNQVSSLASSSRPQVWSVGAVRPTSPFSLNVQSTDGNHTRSVYCITYE